MLFKTNDGGATWTLLPGIPARAGMGCGASSPSHCQPGTRVTLYSVHFTSATVGFVVGSYFSIFRTTDGGATWNEQDSINMDSVKFTMGMDGGFGYPHNPFVSVNFFDAKVGFAAGGGGVIFSTKDGGETWSYDSAFWAGVTWQGITGIAFSDAGNAVAVTMGVNDRGIGKVLRYHDSAYQLPTPSPTSSGASYSCLQIKAAYQNQQCCDNPNGVFAFPTSNTNGDNRRQLQVDSKSPIAIAKKFKILRDLLKQGILRQEEFDTQMMRLLNNLM